MNNTPSSIAQLYYTAMGNKDIAAMTQYLHPEVHLIGPLGNLHGKEAVLKAAEKAFSFFSAITSRATFDADTQAMLAYDWEFPQPIGCLRAAVLMSFENQLIKKIELFFDATHFRQPQP